METIKPDQSVSGPAIRSFNCPGCGGAVEVRAFGQSVSVVCQFCGSVLDPSDKNVKILQKAETALSRKPLIPIGRRGKMEGCEWEVVGFMVRSVPKWEYAWEEYLLFNPWHGYRFLVQSDGHWSWVKTINNLPDTGNIRKTELEFEDKSYKLFSRGETARVDYVLGEFFWRVKRGDKAVLSDFIAPPTVLSVEKGEDEIVWSKGEYVSDSEIRKIFGEDIKLPYKRGIAPNQPNTLGSTFSQILRVYLVFAAILTTAQIYFWMTASNQKIASQSFHPTDSTRAAGEMSMEFSLKGKTSNLNLIFDTDLANSWFFLQGNLYEKNTSINTPFQFTSEFYQGYEEGESWSEGKQDKEVFLNEIKPGDYVLNLEMETDPANKLPGIELTIVHDVPMISNYGIILILMSIPLIAVFFFERSFETRRWQDSDFNPYFVFEGSDSDY